MTVDTYVPTPNYVVAGFGPYPVLCSYSDAADIRVRIRVDPVDPLDPYTWIPLTKDVDYTIEPDIGPAGGLLRLVGTAAKAYEDEVMVIDRQTSVIQDASLPYVRAGIAAERSLDRIARAAQDIRRDIEGADDTLVANAAKLVLAQVTDDLGALDPDVFFAPYLNLGRGTVDWSSWGLTEDSADKVANAAAYTAMLAHASANGLAVEHVGYSIPIASSVMLPPAGNLRWYMSRGGEIRLEDGIHPDESPPAGTPKSVEMVTQADRTTSIPLLDLDLKLRAEERPGTGGIRWRGTGMMVNVSNSDIRCEVWDHWRRQAFLIAGYSSRFYPRSYTDCDLPGSGGCRCVGGVDFQIIEANVVSGDDALQLVPVSSPDPEEGWDNLRCHNIKYIGGRARSWLARAMVMVLDNPDGTEPGTTANITNCGFYGVAGRSGGKPDAGGWMISLEGRGFGQIRNCEVLGCHVDGGDSEGYFPVGVQLRGAVRECNIDVTVTEYPGRLLTVTNFVRTADEIDQAPSDCSIRIRGGNKRVGIEDEPAISIERGTRIRLREPHMIAPSAAPGIRVVGGTDIWIDNPTIRNVAVGQTGIEVIDGTRVAVRDAKMTGDGTAISWAETPAATGTEWPGDYGGMARAGSTPAFLAPKVQKRATVTHNFGSIAPGGTDSAVKAVAGVLRGHVVMVTPRTWPSGLICHATVEADGEVTLHVVNPTGGAINAPDTSFYLSIEGDA